MPIHRLERYRKRVQLESLWDHAALNETKGKLQMPQESYHSVSAPQRILVAIDGSTLSFKALDYSILLARLTHGRITIVNVVIIPSFITSPEVTERLREEASSAGGRLLEKASQLVKDSGLDNVETSLIDTGSSIVKAIVDKASEIRADLIVIGTKGTTEGMPRLMLGSVAVGVVGLASCPVLAVR